MLGTSRHQSNVVPLQVVAFFLFYLKSERNFTNGRDKRFTISRVNEANRAVSLFCLFIICPYGGRNLMFGAEMKEAATHQSTMFITLQIRKIVGPWIIKSTVQIYARSSTHLIVYDAHRDMDVAVKKNLYMKRAVSDTTYYPAYFF